jgi:hypothetical protein
MRPLLDDPNLRSWRVALQRTQTIVPSIPGRSIYPGLSTEMQIWYVGDVTHDDGDITYVANNGYGSSTVFEP